jgi:hypothetical protein
MLKIRKKYTHVYIHILRGHAKFRENGIFFMPYAKKTKICIAKRPILIPKLVIYIDH